MGRASISKGLRFWIFHRDMFTCQYCGASGPDAVLVIDHIHPVASGGETVKSNLITACRACNAGKAAKKLQRTPLSGSWSDPLDFPPLTYTRQKHDPNPLPCVPPSKALTDIQLRICEQVADAECRAFYKWSRALDVEVSVGDPAGERPEDRDEYDRVDLEAIDSNWGYPGEEGAVKNGIYRS